MAGMATVRCFTVLRFSVARECFLHTLLNLHDQSVRSEDIHEVLLVCSTEQFDNGQRWGIRAELHLRGFSCAG
jgi:hypothetical protein